MKVELTGRPTWVTVDLDALFWNFRQVRKLVGPGVRILAVVKANAYGHGATACSRVLAAAGADCFGVATAEEGVELRRAGIRQPVVILGLTQPYEAETIARNRLQPTVIAWPQARSLSAAGQTLRRVVGVHLKIDTGMGRIGLSPEEAGAFSRRIHRLPGLRVEGVFTHFAHADGREQDLLQAQLQRLRMAHEAIRQAGWNNYVVHAANSAAVMETLEAHQNMVRPGLMLYGLYPDPRFQTKVQLRPVLSWHTRVVQVKTVPAGTGLSYGHTFVTQRTSRIATLPLGYADGLSRRLSNRGRVLVRGRECPLVGRICMDTCLADVTALGSAIRLGDEAVLIGRQQGRELAVEEMAKTLDTISYEVLCAIGHRVPRLFSGGGKK
jgi:alanine racemase